MIKQNLYKFNLFDATTCRDVMVRLTALATVAILAVSCNDKAPDAGQLISIVPSYQSLEEADIKDEIITSTRPEASIEISPKVSEGTIATHQTVSTETVSTAPTTPPTTDCMGGPVTNPDGQMVDTLPVSC